MKNPFIIIITAIILIFILGTKAFWSILVLTISIYLLIFVSNLYIKSDQNYLSNKFYNENKITFMKESKRYASNFSWKEISKMFEEIKRGTVVEVINSMTPNSFKGEMVVVIAGYEEAKKTKYNSDLESE